MTITDDIHGAGHDLLTEFDGETITAILLADDSEADITALVHRLGRYGDDKEYLAEFDTGQLTNPHLYKFRVASRVYLPFEIDLVGTVHTISLAFIGSPITYWSIADTTGRAGKPSFNAPVAINGFWMERNEQFRDGQGRENVSQAIVRVDTDLALGGYLYNGTSAEAVPTNEAGAYPIKSFDKMPNRHETTFLRKAFL